MTFAEAPLWLSNLVFWGAQVAVLVLAAGFLPRLFRIYQPRVLLVYWRTLLVISLLLPFVEPWRRAQNIAATAVTPQIDVTRVVTPSSTALSHWNLPSLQIVAQILGVVILVGIAVRFVIFALGLLKLRQFRRTSSPLSSHVESAESVAVLEQMRARVNAHAEFRLSADVDSPVTFGFSAPVILFPENFPSMDARFQAAIACHELLHARRHDWVHHLGEEIIRAALWFHPAIAWLIARVRLAREQVVDHEVVRLTKSPKPYVEALLEFTNGRTAAIPAPPFLVERQLAQRVALMLKEVRMSRARLISSLTVIACTLALAAAFAVWTFPLAYGQATKEGKQRTNQPTAGNSIKEAGEGGYNMPKCEYCPAPSYPDAAFHKHLEGVVMLSVVVGPDDRAHNIVVTKKLGSGLDESAVKAVDGWKFKPATGPDGQPSAVHTLIEVEFRSH